MHDFIDTINRPGARGAAESKKEFAGKLREMGETLRTRRNLEEVQAAFDDPDKEYLIPYRQQRKQSDEPA